MLCTGHAQIAFQSAVEAKTCCVNGTSCGITNQKTYFPLSGSPGFTFNISGDLLQSSSSWTLDIVGTVEGYAIFNTTMPASGKVNIPIGPSPWSILLGHVEIDFPDAPFEAGEILISGRVVLRIPVPYGFGAVVSVKVSESTSGELLICENVYVSSKLLPPPSASGADVIVGGDSWGTFGAKPFADMFTKHGSNVTVYNMAAGGTTSDDWSHGPILEALREAVAKPSTRRVWLSFGGNDAIEHLPFCALQIDPSTGRNKTIDVCTDELIEKVKLSVGKILSTIKDANPHIRVVGFGYDIMGLGKLPICPFVAPEIMPQCWNATAHPEGHVTCFNRQFLKIQSVWTDFATTDAGLGIVDAVSLLGTLQAYGGDSKASTGKPDLSRWGISKLWQVNCIHPTEDVGFPVIFDKFWDLYWSKQQLK
eukprot:g1223.t1